MLYTAGYSSPLGLLTLGSDGENLTNLWLPGRLELPGTPEQPRKNVTCPAAELPVLRAAEHWLNRYFAGEAPAPAELPLAPAGTPFRQAVWRLLCEIPQGEVTTYGALARTLQKQLGKTAMSAQAVGGAVGHNALPIIIPCHRVVGAGGSMVGYTGGLTIKTTLLRLENATMNGRPLLRDTQKQNEVNDADCGD